MQISQGASSGTNVSAAQGSKLASAEGGAFSKSKSLDLLSLFSTILTEQSQEGAPEQTGDEDRVNLMEREDLRNLKGSLTKTTELAPASSPAISSSSSGEPSENLKLPSTKVPAKRGADSEKVKDNKDKNSVSAEHEQGNHLFTGAVDFLALLPASFVEKNSWAIPLPASKNKEISLTNKPASFEGMTLRASADLIPAGSRGVQQVTADAPFQKLNDVLSATAAEEKKSFTAANQIIRPDTQTQPTNTNATSHIVYPQTTRIQAQQPADFEKLSLSSLQGSNSPQTSQLSASIGAQVVAPKFKSLQKSDAGPVGSGSVQIENVGSGAHARTHAEIFAAPTGGGENTHTATLKSTSEPSQISVFQRMDSQESQATLLKVNSHQVAVGVRDPSLGWVEIQTQSSAGHVSALLAAASPEAHAKLVAETPALAQYMSERDVPVHTVSVAMQGGEANGGQSRSSSQNGQQQGFESEQNASHDSQAVAWNSSEEAEVLNPGSALRISVRA
ncbi:MAG TPA: hypothetical protein VHT24_10710 [Pseudacidobacterium sp.]|nr:hypothetical protein [Pseudacidobacterium sp.]